MIQQPFLANKWLWAEFAFISLNIVVCSYVRYQPRCLLETMVTDLAYKRCFASMRTFVIHKMGDLRERFVTESAGMRAFTWMNTFVQNQSDRLLESKMEYCKIKYKGLPKRTRTLSFEDTQLRTPMYPTLTCFLDVGPFYPSFTECCLLMWYNHPYRFLQSGHWYGRSLVWVRTCRFLCDIILKLFSQCSHW